jgi:hypothetical protein
VPDEAGERYDREMAKVRAARQAEDRGLNPIGAMTGALGDFQNGPKIARPSFGWTLVPVVGPAWEAAANLQDGDYLGTGINGAAAIADVAGLGVAVKGVRALSKGVGLLNTGSMTAESSRKILRARGLAKPGQEIHHTRALNGLGRSVPDDRNHYMFLKVMPQETHRRLRGSWNGKPKFDPIRRTWHNATEWQQAIVGYGATHTGIAAERMDDPRR